MKGDFTRFTFDPKKRYTRVLKQQGRVDLDADWNEQSAIDSELDRVSRMDLSGVESGAPSLNPGFEVTLAGGDLNFSPGRFYLEGLICELLASTTYLTQPFLPNPPPLTPANNQTDLVYLDAWQRHITAIEDPSIREVALEGPDTCTRVQTIFQVRIAPSVGASVDCSNAPLPPKSDAGLTTSLVPVPPEDDLCLIGATGGYRGLENRLYRVEIHDLGPLGTATFKWSRDNGSVVFPITEFVVGQSHKIRVKRLGRDQVLSLREGDYVEVLDDNNELLGTPGTMAQVQLIDAANLELTLSAAVAGSLAAHPKVRRWDQKSLPITVSAGPIALESGIQVSFSGSTFKTGDYWMFAARVTDGSIEILTGEPAQGIRHEYARLALITWHKPAGGPVTITVHDCRKIFPAGGTGCCTVVVHPGESIQAAIDSLPAAGGCVCLKTGVHTITATVRINRSNVLIHGETLGAIVTGPDSLPDLIDVSKPGVTLSRVMVEEITFIGGFEILNFSNVNGGAIKRCRFLGTDSSFPPAIWVQDSSDILIENNDIAVVSTGITIINCDSLDVLNNRIEGAIVQGRVFEGFHGILVTDNRGKLLVKNNRIKNFSTAILIDRRFTTASSDPMVAVCYNNISRARMSPVPGSSLFHIEIKDSGCLVSNNRIELEEPSHGGVLNGGILIQASHTRVIGNRLSTTGIQVGRDVAPVGIRVESGSPALRNILVQGNVFLGPQSAVQIDRVASTEMITGLEIRDNLIEAPPTNRSPLSIAVISANRALIAGNRIVGADLAITLVNGRDNSVQENFMLDGANGISVFGESGIDISQNVVDNMETSGILGNTTTDVSCSHNRIARCGYLQRLVNGSGPLAIGIGFDGSGRLLIDSCEVIDIGAFPTGATDGQVAAIGISAHDFLEYHLNNNVVVAAQGLNPALDQHLAIELLGPGPFSGLFNAALAVVGGGTQPFTPTTSAELLGNVIRAVGGRHAILVGGVLFDQISGASFLIDKIIFSNNRCEQLSPSTSSSSTFPLPSTVLLQAMTLSVIGNQVRSDRNTASFGFLPGNQSRLTAVGNVTSGNWNSTPSTITPGPLSSFNLMNV